MAGVKIYDEKRMIKRSVFTGALGNSVLCLPIGSDYQVQVEKENYVFKSQRFELSEMRELANPEDLHIYLAKIEDNHVEQPVILQNVLFESGSSILLPSSFVELNRLVQFLENNTAVRIEIRGHTDDVGDKKTNQLLSEERATSVLNYLKESGIESERLRAIGFGESMPIADNTTEKGRQQNRRTEFVIEHE